MNSLKHAFPRADTKGQIIIAFEISGTDWELSVADNGIGKQDGVFAQPKTGLGGIVKALAQSLNAKVETLSGVGGGRLCRSLTRRSQKPVMGLGCVQTDRSARGRGRQSLQAAKVLASDRPMTGQSRYGDAVLRFWTHFPAFRRREWLQSGSVCRQCSSPAGSGKPLLDEVANEGSEVLNQ